MKSLLHDIWQEKLNDIPMHDWYLIAATIVSGMLIEKEEGTL